MAGYEQPGPGHEGMDDCSPALSPRVGRRAFLKAAGAVGAAGIAAPVLSGTRALAIAGTRSARAAARATPLQHVIIDCQENRSFDHYYGFAPFAGSAAVPPGYSQPDGAGGSLAPSEFTSLSTPDIGHSWTAVHSEWDAGKMDGFYTTDGINCMGYYTAAQLPFYYRLFDDFTLCGSYFCSVRGPTGSTSRPERPGASPPTACCGARKYDSGWPAFFRGGVGGKAVM
jgi:phospholipase C